MATRGDAATLGLSRRRRANCICVLSPDYPSETLFNLRSGTDTPPTPLWETSTLSLDQRGQCVLLGR